MGADMSCPAGFEPGFLSCHVKCPPNFRYMQEGSPPNIEERCVYQTDPSVSFRLTSLPMVRPNDPVDGRYAQELQRVRRETEVAQRQIDMQANTVAEFQQQSTRRADRYSQIQSRHAQVADAARDQRRLREVTNSLKPFRPPTQPSSDLEQERRAILEVVQHNLLLIQIVLFLLVLSLLSYLMLPYEYANGLTFLLLCVGIALGFFLRK